MAGKRRKMKLSDSEVQVLMDEMKRQTLLKTARMTPHRREERNYGSDGVSVGAFKHTHTYRL